MNTAERSPIPSADAARSGSDGPHSQKGTELTAGIDAAAADRYALAFRPSWAPLSHEPPPPPAAKPVEQARPAHERDSREHAEPLRVPGRQVRRRAGLLAGASVLSFVGLVYWGVSSTTQTAPPPHVTELASATRAPAAQPRPVPEAPSENPPSAPEPSALAPVSDLSALRARPEPAAPAQPALEEQAAPGTGEPAPAAEAQPELAAANPSPAPAEAAAPAAEARPELAAANPNPARDESAGTPLGSAPASKIDVPASAAPAAPPSAATAPAKAPTAVASAPPAAPAATTRPAPAAAPIAVASAPPAATARPAPAAAPAATRPTAAPAPIITASAPRAPASPNLASGPRTEPIVTAARSDASAPARKRMPLLSVRALPEGARLFLDGQRLPNPFDMRLPEGGKHKLEARYEGYETSSQTVRIESDAKLTITLRRTDAPLQVRPLSQQGPQRGAGFVTSNPY